MTEFEITIDAELPSRLAHFWAEALRVYSVRPYDQEEIERLSALGLTPETDPSVPIDGPGPTIWFQKVDEPCSERNRLHFDLKFGVREDERRRLEKLGARVLDVRNDHIVMCDPEGNQFCLFDP